MINGFCNQFATKISEMCYPKFPLFQTRISTSSCDHFGRHGEWKKYLATKLLVKVGNWRPTDLKRNLLEKLSKIGQIYSIVQVAASPVFLFSPLIVQKVKCVNLNELRLKMANLIQLKGFCAPLAMLPNLSCSFVMMK